MSSQANDNPAPNDALRWPVVLFAAFVFWATFYAYEHKPSMYAAGARAAAGEDRLRDQFVDEQASGSLIRRLAIIGFAAAGMVGLVNARGLAWNVQPALVVLLGLLLAWAALSCFFAENSGVAIRRYTATVLAVVGTLGFARLLRPQEVIATALISLSVFVSTSLAIDIAAGGRPWAGGQRFGGTLHANTQAMYVGALCLAAYTMPAGFGVRWMPRLVLLGGLGAMVLTRSRTGLVAVVLALIVAGLVSLSSRIRWAAAAMVLSVAALALLTIASVSVGDRTRMRNSLLMGRTEQAGSLTGRVPLWDELSGYVQKRPLTGYGFEGFWTPRRIDLVMKSQGWALQSAHNAYLEVTLQIGLVGLTLALGFVFGCALRMQQACETTNNPGYAFGLGLIALGLLDSFLQSHFHAVSYPTMLALLPMLSIVFFYPAAVGERETTTRPATHGRVAPAYLNPGRQASA